MAANARLSTRTEVGTVTRLQGPGGVAEFPGDEADLDSGGGTDDHGVVAIGLPNAGGHVVGGTAADPLRVDPTGTTAQPITDNNGSITVDGAVSITGTVVVSSVSTTVVVDASGFTVPISPAGGSMSIDDGGGIITVDGVVDIQDGGGSITIDDGGTPLNVDTELPASAALQDGTANPTCPAVGVFLHGWNAVTWDRLLSSQTYGLEVDVTRLQGTISAGGNVAHDAADSGNPVKTGGKAINHGANPTAVAANDRTDHYTNRHGIPFVVGGHPNIITKEWHFTAAQTNYALITVGSGTKIVVTHIDATVDGATTPDVGVRVGFAAAALSAVSSSGVTGIVLSHAGVKPGSGIVRGSAAGIIGVGADGEDLRLTSEIPTDGSLRIVASYYTIEG